VINDRIVASRGNEEQFELGLGVRRFAYSFGFMLGTIALLAIAFMLLVWSLE
jgi:hypothetical protein